MGEMMQSLSVGRSVGQSAGEWEMDGRWIMDDGRWRNGRKRQCIFQE